MVYNEIESAKREELEELELKRLQSSLNGRLGIIPLSVIGLHFIISEFN